MSEAAAKLMPVSKAIRAEIENGVKDAESIFTAVNARIQAGEVKKVKSDENVKFLIKRALKK